MKHNARLPENQINLMSLKEAAIFYATQGFQVFPLQNNSKDPIPGFSWSKLATSDIEWITDWWTRYPDNNIAIRCGKESGIVVLDVDMKHQADGVRSYQAIAQDEYIGPVQQTPSGGYHLFFKYEDGLINFTRRGIYGGLDMRTNNGYIVASPSRIYNGRYHFISGGEPIEMNQKARDAFISFSADRNNIVDEIPEIPEETFDYHAVPLAAKYMRYLDEGDTGPWDHDESRAVFAVAGALQKLIQDDAQVFKILLDNPYAWNCATRHRKWGNAAAWLWKYGIAKAVKSATQANIHDIFKPLGEEAEKILIKDDDQGFQGKLFKSAKRLFKMAEIPPQWLIQGYLARGEVGVIYAESGVGKSFIVNDMGLHIALGRTWWGHAVVSPGPVLYIAAEGNQNVGRRLRAWCQFQNYYFPDLPPVDADILEGRYFVSDHAIDMLDISTLMPAIEDVQSTGITPALVIIDTLAANMIGNENDTRDASAFVNQCKQMASGWHCGVLVVHHTGLAANDRMRGSTALRGGFDTIMRLSPVESETKTVELSVDQARDYGEAAPKIFELKRQIIWDLSHTTEIADSLVPQLTHKTHPDIDIKTAVKLGKRQKVTYSHILEVIARSSSLSCPEGMLDFDGIWTAIKLMDDFKDRNAKYNVKRDLMKFAEKGLLKSEIDDHGKVWFKKP